MGIRESINQKPAVVGGVVCVMVVLAVVICWPSRSTGVTGTGAFYTTDDGATWFSGSKMLVPPFEYGGKAAVRAHVYKCNNGKMVVGYMERYTPEAKRVLDAARNRQGTPSEAEAVEIGKAMDQREMKRPGEANWQPIKSGGLFGIAGTPCGAGQYSMEVITD